MLVLIDESGDCGLKFDQGSSDLLVCVAVVFTSAFSADACDRAIDCLRLQMGKPLNFEFHFSHCSDKARSSFLKTVNHEDFRYAGFVVDKRKLYGPRFSKPKEVYEFAVRMVCEHVRVLLDNSKIIIDKNGDRDFRTKLSKTLKSEMTDGDGTCRIRKVAMEGSHTNNLLQLADMVCGALHRSHSGSDDRFRDLIRGKEKFVQRWPN